MGWDDGPEPAAYSEALWDGNAISYALYCGCLWQLLPSPLGDPATQCDRLRLAPS